MTKAFKIYLAGAVVLLLGHFLPLVKVLDENYNMMEVGKLNSFGSGNPVTVLMVVLLVGVLLAFIANRIGSRAGKIILYLLALLVGVLYFFLLLNAQWFEGGAEKLFGFWILMLGTIGMIVGGLMGFAEKKA